ncbi:MAG: hypothetical protein FWC73_05875 [Defluviitaleaceae bacterium]|nr:hypothetical protein [Defluviitaleaceae bacterium]
MRKAKTAMSLVIIAAIIVAITACSSETRVVSSWTTSGTLTHNNEVDSWFISINRVNGNSMRDITFTSESLTELHVENTNSSGSVVLIITQDETERRIDISDNFNEILDISDDFEPGSIRLRLEFESAENVRVSLSW